jgi:DNA-binding NarL/FixJ family response regulator
MINEAFSVAVVDDDPMMRQLIADTLARKFPQAHVEHYSIGEDLLASALTPDLAILDYHLDAVKPDALNGLQVLTKLKDRYRDLPVIFLTAQDRLDVATNTIKYGAYDYIVKNETAFARLENAISNIVQLSSLRKTSKSQGLMNKVFWALIFVLLAYILYLRMQ